MCVWVSRNGGTPKWMVFNGKSIYKCTHINGNTHMLIPNTSRRRRAAIVPRKPKSWQRR